MGKVVFNIVETDYDVSKDEEKYQKFRKDYLENLSVGVSRLQEQYGLIDEVMDLQLLINSLRNKFDLVDESEQVYDEFVQ